MQEAYAAAKEEHSTTSSEPVAAVASTATGGAATMSDEAKAPPPAKEGATSEISDLISDDELATLKTKHKNDPDALAKELKGVFTKKTQALSEQRKALEGLEDYKDFIADLRANPTDAIARAAEQFGLTVAPKAKAEETAAKTASAQIDALMEGFKAQLGPDLSFLADTLGPAVKGLVENIVKTTVGQAIEPLQQSQQVLRDKAAAEATDQTLSAFTKKYPEWQKHEPEMVKLGERFQPGKDVSADEYMESLYLLATKDTFVADGVKKAVERMTNGAKASEGKSESVADSKVTVARPANPSFKDAYEAAKRGERWE